MVTGIKDLKIIIRPTRHQRSLLSKELRGMTGWPANLASRERGHLDLGTLLHTRVHSCTDMHRRIRIVTHTHTQTYTDMHTHADIHTYTDIHVQTHIHTCRHTQTRTHIESCRHTYSHVHSTPFSGSCGASGPQNYWAHITPISRVWNPSKEAVSLPRALVPSADLSPAH